MGKIKIMKKNFIIGLIAVLAIVGVVGGFLIVIKSRIKTKTEDQPQSTSQEKNVGKRDLFERGINVCELIPPTEISKLLGKNVSRTERGESDANPVPSCFYYLKGEKTVYIELNANEDVGEQTRGWEILGNETKKDSSISMENFVVYTKEGKIRRIYLLINSKSFVTVDPWDSGLTEQEIIDFANKFAGFLQENFNI
ncbi:MAG: hypothetical protein QXD41_02495 [Nitrososphaeria archaeon]